MLSSLLRIFTAGLAELLHSLLDLPLTTTPSTGFCCSPLFLTHSEIEGSPKHGTVVKLRPPAIRLPVLKVHGLPSGLPCLGPPESGRNCMDLFLLLAVDFFLGGLLGF